MADSIFTIEGDGSLREMTAAPYDSEDLLQRLLADYPDLLGGREINPDDPRRWLLVRREMGVPNREGGGSQWSLDHLFLDQDGIPTFVETKRAENRELRRDVVGQMLDYAANASAYWSLDTIRTTFEEARTRDGADPDLVLQEFLGAEADPDAFWVRVGEHLASGRLRLLFVADEIPAELRRIVEFLNDQMERTEVLAVEIRHFTGGALRTLVPRVIGQTERAQVVKAGSGKSRSMPWDESSLLEQASAFLETEDVDTIKTILEWARGRNLARKWGRGKVTATCSFQQVIGGSAASILWLSGDGYFAINFAVLAKYPSFADANQRAELVRQVNEIPGINLPPKAVAGYPNILIPVLRTDVARTRFLQILDELADRLEQD